MRSIIQSAGVAGLVVLGAGCTGMDRPSYGYTQAYAPPGYPYYQPAPPAFPPRYGYAPPYTRYGSGPEIIFTANFP